MDNQRFSTARCLSYPDRSDTAIRPDVCGYRRGAARGDAFFSGIHGGVVVGITAVLFLIRLVVNTSAAALVFHVFVIFYMLTVTAGTFWPLISLQRSLAGRG
mgnify:CR=1 FL=1